MTSVSVQNLTRYAVPRFAYTKVAAAALPNWDISLVFMDPVQAKRLNMKLRKKSYVPNVLSYAAGAHSGEIIICPSVVREQAPLYNLRPTTYTLYLFIHGLLHLEGGRHGTTMERREQELLKQFSAPSRRTHGTTHRNGHRHRDLPGQDGRRRRGPR